MFFEAEIMNIVPRSQCLSPEHVFDYFFCLKQTKRQRGLF
jgi:hypothetical protein